MTFPDKTTLESLWDGNLGDAVTIKTVSLTPKGSYGDKIETYSAGTSAQGRVKIIQANKAHKEFGYLVPGDAVVLLKLAATVVLNDLIVFDSISYKVFGLVKKRTHQELACKRVS